MFCAEGISLLNFDFGGSGNSGGQYVTLGWYEKVDFLAVLDYIKEKYEQVFNNQAILFWVHSVRGEEAWEQ